MVYSKTLRPEDELPKWLPKLGAYLLHIVLAWIGILAISLFLGAGVSWLNDNLAGAIFFESPYPGEIALGLLIGYAANKFLRSRFVLWFWVVPTLPILDEFYGSPWRIHSTTYSWRDAPTVLNSFLQWRRFAARSPTHSAPGSP